MGKHNNNAYNSRKCLKCGKNFNAVYEEYGELKASNTIRVCKPCKASFRAQDFEMITQQEANR